MLLTFLSLIYYLNFGQTAYLLAATAPPPLIRQFYIPGRIIPTIFATAPTLSSWQKSSPVPATNLPITSETWRKRFRNRLKLYSDVESLYANVRYKDYGRPLQGERHVNSTIICLEFGIVLN
ncbi:hypothetical protein GWI33_017176 [Rhynchophorus ferrugineus]|uniref:Uncharacterized protein n=1 Tax=Rhynchophorus ferrugineus TaxID=354439 RepID=A0A834M7W9_RHYFE|nr:hypothetical protein GWI33_017176 [Rhynchophorus ferrugineus]